MEQISEPDSSIVVPLSINSCLDCKYCGLISGVDKLCRRRELFFVKREPYSAAWPLCRDMRSDHGDCGSEGVLHEHWSSQHGHYRHPLPQLPPLPLLQRRYVREPHVPRTYKSIDWNAESSPREHPPVWGSPVDGSLWFEVWASAIIVGVIIAIILFCLVGRFSY